MYGRFFPVRPDAPIFFQIAQQKIQLRQRIIAAPGGALSPSETAVPNRSRNSGSTAAWHEAESYGCMGSQTLGGSSHCFAGRLAKIPEKAMNARTPMGAGKIFFRRRVRARMLVAAG